MYVVHAYDLNSCIIIIIIIYCNIVIINWFQFIMCCIMAVTVSVDNKNLSTCMQLLIQMVPLQEVPMLVAGLVASLVISAGATIAVLG